MSGMTDAATRARDVRLRAVLEEAAGCYRVRVLVLRPAVVVGVLRDRGLADLVVGTPAGLRWRVGHAPGGVSRTELVQHLRRCGFDAEEMVAAGVAVPSSSAGRASVGRWRSGVVDVLRNRLVVPLVDAGGVVGFTARRLSETNPAVPKWVNTATTVLYRKGEHLLGVAQQAEQLTAGRGRVVLVEGAVDAFAVDLAGHIGVAAGGTQLTAAHAAQLRDAAAAPLEDGCWWPTTGTSRAGRPRCARRACSPGWTSGWCGCPRAGTRLMCWSPPAPAGCAARSG